MFRVRRTYRVYERFYSGFFRDSRFRVWFAAYHEARASDPERLVLRISVTSTVLSISNYSTTQNSSKEMLD